MKTFGELYYKEDNWILDKLEPHVSIKLKNIFGKINKSQKPPFIIRHSKESAFDIHWFTQRYPLKITDQDKMKLIQEKESQVEFMNSMEQLFKPDYKPREIKLKKQLRNYQLLGIEFFKKSKRVLIGDVTGLGKTPLAIGALDSQTLPAIITMQTHMPTQWEQKINEFSDLSVHVIKTTKPYQLPKADVYICTYSKLSAWVDVLSNLAKTFICDEIQEFRKSDSNKYQAGKSIADSCEYVMGLSATPIYNYGDEAWNIFNLIKDGCLDYKYNFMREWCNDGNIVGDPKALGTYLRENNLFLRRTRKDVGRELPPLNKIVHTVDFDESELNKIQDLAKTLAIKVMQGSFVERGQASRDLDIMVRHATGVSKAKGVANYVKMILESGEPVLLAGWHRDVYEIWNKELEKYKPVMYTGTESPSQKEESKRKFINGESDLMLISLRSGVGLDGLQERCKFVVIGELDWSPKVHEQIIGRVDRDKQDGNNNHVTVVFLTSDSGSDPAIIEILGLKSSQSSGITDPLATVETINMDDSRIKMIAKSYLGEK